MSEINKPEIKLSQPSSRTGRADIKPENRPELITNQPKDYKEAAAAPGAEAAGRAQLMISKTAKADNIETDIQKILNNPSILDDSEVLFNAAEKAGIPYPVAATFATQELV
ncbi:MAG: hypothetical protein LUB59_03250 [Candidatus Gastranaerophilales bacterium]|nr:hypothetical protein [Candidatus Gastranaerophilales bacterium]